MELGDAGRDPGAQGSYLQLGVQDPGLFVQPLQPLSVSLQLGRGS